MASFSVAWALVAAVGIAIPSPASAMSPPPTGTHWRWPVRGAVTERFHVTPDRFARGQHRGIDIAAAPGTRVRSACPGRVSFAGVVPGGGRTLSVRCGDLTATYQHLGATALRRGAAVAEAASLGSVGSADLHFGVHRSADRHAYVDPLSLLRGPRPQAPSPLAPVARGPRGRPLGAPPSPPPPHLARPRARAITAGAPKGVAGGRVPLVAWIGAGLVVLALPGWGVRRARRRYVGPAAKRVASTMRASQST